jgi:hypothetical protein
MKFFALPAVILLVALALVGGASATPPKPAALPNCALLMPAQTLQTLTGLTNSLTARNGMQCTYNNWQYGNGGVMIITSSQVATRSWSQWTHGHPCGGGTRTDPRDCAFTPFALPHAQGGQLNQSTVALKITAKAKYFVQVWAPAYQDGTPPQLTYDQEVVVVKAILAKLK